MSRQRRIALALAGGLLALAALTAALRLREAPAADTAMQVSAERELLRGYRRLAHLSYEAAYHSAGRLRKAIAALLAEPSAETLDAARAAWRAARVDYSQTEALRFGHWIVDDWETAINAWPVDEGLLDYVAEDDRASPTNPLARQNLVARPLIEVGGLQLDTQELDWRQLKFIHGGGEIEANVVLGYHAIEFLLWGQDRRLSAPGAGERPWTDYAADTRCTSGPRAAPLAHCARRGRLLEILAEHLYSELGQMTLNWAGNHPNSYGLHIAEGPVDEGLRRLLFGLVRLAGDEMAGERLQVALLSGAPEEEQDCFSDDTHQSTYFNGLGIENLYYGRLPAAEPGGPPRYSAPQSLAALARARDAALADQIDRAFAETRAAASALRALGASGQTFDLLIQPEHPQGQRVIVRLIEALEAQSQLLEQLGQALALGPLNPQRAQPAAS
jgi:putative iron-regulated protein